MTRKLLLLLFGGVLLAAQTVFAEAEMVDGIEWYYTVSNGEASLGGGTYSSTAISTSTSGAITIPSKLGGYPVTSIGDYAFYFCRNLTSVTIPDSVTSIGSGAFDNCSGLTSVTIPDSVTCIGSFAFYGCSRLTNVDIPDSVTTISSIAFVGCSSLGSIIIPASVTNISWGGYAPIGNVAKLGMEFTA